MLHAATESPRKRDRHRKLSIETVLSAIALVLLTSIFLKAIIDVDVSYDPWWYHLPFAARIWDIVPPEMFMGDEKWFEPRFAGFPLLAHFLQGWLWFISGRVQTANLVCFLSLITYLVFLRTYFKIPLYLSAIALLAIPLVLTHAATCFIDLPGNIGVSILVMISYLAFTRQQLPTKWDLSILVLAAAAAANIKTQLQPLVLVIVCVVGVRLAWLYWRHSGERQLVKVALATVLAFLLIFATPVKNTIVYGNPLYPIKVEVAGVVLNHELVPEAYQEGNRRQKWLYSILEIKSAPWSADMGNVDTERNRMGGFFGAYVVFNLLLLLALAIKESFAKSDRETYALRAYRAVDARAAIATVILMSLIPANFPQSHELRYFMFWMICLVSLNLYLVSRIEVATYRQWLQPKYLGLVCTAFLIIVLSKVGSFYAVPKFITLEQHMEGGVKPEFFSQIKPDSEVCLVSKHVAHPQKANVVAIKSAFLYSSYFHPELDYSYSVNVAFEPQNCGDRQIIPHNIAEVLKETTK